MPKEWEATTLGEAAEVLMGQSPPGSSYNTEGLGMPFLQGSAEFGERFPVPAKWCTAPTRIAREGDLLFSVRAPVGDMNIANQELAIGRGLAAIRGSDLSTTTFIALALEAHLARIQGSAGGGMFQSITKAGLFEAELDLPPLPEQLRIADLMSAVDGQLASYDAQIAAGSRRRSALLNELLKPQEGWDATIFSEVAHLEYGKALKSSERSGSGCPVYGSSGVVGLHEPALVPDPTVIIGRKGNAGAVYLASGPSSPIDTVYWVRLKSSDVLMDWLGLWCENHDLPGLGQKGARPSLSRDIVHEQEVSIPPLPDQQHVAGLMGAVDDELDVLREARDQAKTLRTALLQDLLSGTHRIPESYDRLLKKQAAPSGAETAQSQESNQAAA